MFHVTDAQWRDLGVFFVLIYGFYLVDRIRAELRVIAYNTGRTSENVAAVLHRLNSK
jgi:hypothetical protein